MVLHGIVEGGVEDGVCVRSVRGAVIVRDTVVIRDVQGMTGRRGVIRIRHIGGGANHPLVVASALERELGHRILIRVFLKGALVGQRDRNARRAE